MAGGPYGPLVEPGWPSTLPSAPDLGQKFLSGFAMGSEINRRKQQLEQQLEKMALENKRMEINQDLREREFQFKMGQAETMNQFRQQQLESRLGQADFMNWYRQQQLDQR